MQLQGLLVKVYCIFQFALLIQRLFQNNVLNAFIYLAHDVFKTHLNDRFLRCMLKLQDGWG